MACPVLQRDQKGFRTECKADPGINIVGERAETIGR